MDEAYLQEYVSNTYFFRHIFIIKKATMYKQRKTERGINYIILLIILLIILTCTGDMEVDINHFH